MRAGAILLGLVLLAGPASAQQLATEHFDPTVGLAHSEISHVYQDRHGYLWISTWEGLSRYDGRQFETFGVQHGLPAGLINGVIEMPDGTLYVATNGRGLGRLVDGPAEWFDTISLGDRVGIDFVNGLLVDIDGRLWCSTDAGLVRGDRDEAGWTFRLVQPISGSPVIVSPHRGASDRLYIPVGTEVVVVDPRAPDEVEVLPELDGASVRSVTAGDAPGEILALTERGLYALDDPWDAGWRPMAIRAPAGTRLTSILRTDDTLWIGSDGAVLEVRGSHTRSWSIGRGFRPAATTLFRDLEQNLWIGTGQGLYRAPPERIVEYREVPETTANPIVGLVALPDGSVIAETRAGLFELRDEGPRALSHPPTDEMPPPPLGGVVETPRGTTWTSGMSWLRQSEPGGLAHEVRIAGLPRVHPRTMLLDSRGWLWIGLRYEGVVFTREPDAAAPVFERLTTNDGLSSNTASCLAEDDAGRIYLGTGRGLDRIDVGGPYVAAVGPATVLGGAWVQHCVTDRRGRIWASTNRGVARVEPTLLAGSEAPPPLYITHVEIDGASTALPGRGGRAGTGVVVPAGAESVRVEFTAVTMRPERRLRYEHRLVGLDDAWHAAPAERSVYYGRLPPGRYRFEVRAVPRTGLAGVSSADVRFEVLAPFWRTWWFVGLAGLVAGGGALGWHRSRVRHLLALESVRRQVALDLHDDVGAGLAQVSILSEVARRGSGEAVASRLDQIGRLSRALRGSMGDIVWAVDPRFDTLADVTARVREVASGLLESQGIAFEMTAPPADVARAIRLGPEQRRHVARLANEVVTNAARHAGARRVAVRLAVEGGALSMTFEDDGQGFDVDAVEAGRNGLQNLSRRTAALGGALEIKSTSSGTRVDVTIPLGRGT